MDIPEELQFRDVRKQAPVIISKESRQVLPQNGTKFQQGDSGTTQIVFRLPNEENSSTDLSTMWIVADLSISGLDTATYTQVRCNRYNSTNKDLFDTSVANSQNLPVLSCCDSIESALKSVHILVNGSELERFDSYNYLESINNMHTNNANFSNSIGAGCMLMNLNHYEKSKLFLQNATAARTSSNVVQVAFPLRWAGIANLRSLVPTYMLANGQSSIEIRIFLENANKFLIAGLFNDAINTAFANRFTPASNLTYTLDNVRMNYDIVQTSDAYTSSLRSYLASNQLTLPIDTYYTTQFDIPSTANGWLNFTISTQMSDISAVFIAFCRASEQSSYTYASTDRFFKPGNLTEARLQINGKPYPNVNVRLSGDVNLPEAEAYQYLMKALRQNCSLEVIGNANSNRDSKRSFRINDRNASTVLLPTNAANSAAAPTKAEFDAAVAVINNTIVASNSITTKELYSGNGLYYGVNKSPVINNFDVAANQPTANFFEDDSYFFESCSNFCLGFDISKSNYNNEYELSGQDLTKSSGLIQVNLRFNGNPQLNTHYVDATPTTALGLQEHAFQAIVVVKHKRILDIGLDSSQVIY